MDPAVYSSWNQPNVVSSNLSSTAIEPAAISWNSLVVDPLTNFFVGAASYIPGVLTALCIILTAWVIGRLLQFLVSLFLQRIGFDAFAGHIGVTRLLEESGSKVLPHRWFGALVFWIVLVGSFVVSLGHLNLNVASLKLAEFVAFILTVLGALITVIFGLFLSFVCARVVLAIAKNIHLGNPELCAALAQGVVLAFTTLVALIQIGLKAEIVLVAVGAVLATLCITFILAFGLGGRTWAGKVLEKTLPDDKKGNRP